MDATTFFTLSLLFLSFTPKLGESARPSRGILPPAVVDTSGNEVRKGEYYDLLAWPGIIGVASTISPLVEKNGTCWVQHKFEPISDVTTPSVPVTFSPLSPDEGDIIRESTALNIDFAEAGLPYVCGDSLWRLLNHPDRVFKQQFVVVGTMSGFTSHGYFKIEGDSNYLGRDYKLIFCHLLESGSLQHSFYDYCHIVGIFADDEKTRRLTLANTSVPFAFSHHAKLQSDQLIQMSVS